MKIDFARKSAQTKLTSKSGLIQRKYVLMLASRGYVLVSSVLIMALLLLLGTASGIISLTNVSVSRNVRSNAETQAEAEGELDAAIAYVMKERPSFDTTTNSSLLTTLGNVNFSNHSNLQFRAYAPTATATNFLNSSLPPSSYTPPTSTTGIKAVNLNTTAGVGSSIKAGCYSNGLDGVSTTAGIIVAVQNSNANVWLEVELEDTSGNKSTRRLPATSTGTSGWLPILVQMGSNGGIVFGAGNSAKIRTYLIDRNGNRTRQLFTGFSSTLTHNGTSSILNSGSSASLTSPLCLCTTSTTRPPGNKINGINISNSACTGAPTTGPSSTSSGSINTNLSYLWVTSTATDSDTNAEYEAKAVVQRDSSTTPATYTVISRE